MKMHLKISSGKWRPFCPGGDGLTYLDNMLVAIVSVQNRHPITLHWRHNDHDSVSNHQPHGCLLNRLFRRRSKKTSKLCVTGLCAGNSPGPVNSLHKGPVTRKMFPFVDVIMICSYRADSTIASFSEFILRSICLLSYALNTLCLGEVGR